MRVIADERHRGSFRDAARAMTGDLSLKLKNPRPVAAERGCGCGLGQRRDYRSNAVSTLGLWPHRRWK